MRSTQHISRPNTSSMPFARLEAFAAILYNGHLYTPTHSALKVVAVLKAHAIALISLPTFQPGSKSKSQLSHMSICYVYHFVEERMVTAIRITPYLES